jgi:UDPglucose 6-dehydrogenase
MATIGFIGLGKLGLPMACCLEAAGNIVLGVDYAVEQRIKEARDSKEPGLQEMFGVAMSQAGGLSIADTYKLWRNEPLDIIIILVNTPVVNGEFSLVQVESALQSVIQNVPAASLSQLPIVISSTVSPGSCSYLSKAYGILNLCYIPDFVALGSVIHDFQNPEVFIVGAEDQGLAERVIHIVKTMHVTREANAPPAILNLRDAELAKVFLNNYIAMKISYANLIDQLCEDGNEVTRALGEDSRIGSKYFKPGLPWGGQCFPRDVAVMQHIYPQLAEFIEGVNNLQYKTILDRVLETVSVEDSILVLGMGFKPHTDCQDNSFGVWLVAELLARGYRVQGADYEALDDVLNDTIDTIDTIIITHNDQRLRNYNYGGRQVIDLWNL